MINPNFNEMVDTALIRISKFIRKTPLQHSKTLSTLSGSEVYLKLENYQVTGSFKARGATNKLMLLSEQSPQKIITASSGNHGSAVAFASAKLNLDVLIFLPETVSLAKLNKIKSYGAEVKISGHDSGDAELAAKKYAESKNYPYLSPYNDLDVITGQGTAAAEVCQDIARLDAVFIAVGGGGLISGMGGKKKKKIPKIQVVACSPENSSAMDHALSVGRIEQIEHSETLSDGTAGALEQGSITFDYCQSIIDRSLLVSEDQITEAMKDFIGSHQMLIEGSAAVAIAGFLKDKESWKNKKVLIVICGANVSNEILLRVLK
ncbi:MAG: threonine/serine dehydratase [Gammaproteobacteria bacterium]|nr:threonine/serine dehydratase [Gammaproteobacteria bacterium]